MDLDKYIYKIKDANTITSYGKVSKVVGLMIESTGPNVKIGDICKIYTYNRENFVLAEVVGLRNEVVMLMPFSDVSGIGYGSMVESTSMSIRVNVGPELIGRIVDGLGNPIDKKGPIMTKETYPIDNQPPSPLDRKNIEDVLPLGVRAIDGLLTCGKGQRIGIFAGSGVGKSTLLGMIARYAKADVNVIVLVGERGREVNEFIQNDLKEEGLARSVVVVATSDKPALIRVKAALVGTAIAEYFRDQGKDVMLLVDSLTRFSMAQREIGLASSEPPVARGYTPSVFSVLPKLLERAGNSDKGSITGLYTVLVDGDDLNEPITDAVRGILDGHIVLSRKLANRNHYPAIDVLASISRLMPIVAEKEHIFAANAIKDIMSVYNDAQDLINIGAYKRGSNKKIDKSIDTIDRINKFLCQYVTEKSTFEETLNEMFAIYEELKE
ncbi:MAG: flagellar protein export ATPase FliI [Clostridiaceae bacterium]|nr:flagellar protein export ATPase FliI [Clostridiaceae bacterium]